MSDWKSRSTIVPPAKSSWKDRSEIVEKEKTGQLTAAIRGGVQGISGGFADELAGGIGGAIDYVQGEGDLKSLYEKNRDEQRSKNEQSKKDWPKTYGATQIGASIVPTVLTAGTSIPAMAASGAAQGLGYSEADLTKGEIGQAAKDTATGAAISAGTGAAAKSIGSLVARFNDKFPNATEGMRDTFNKYIAKLYSKTAGVDEEAILSQIKQPKIQKAAEKEGFSYITGTKAKEGIDKLGKELGQGVAEARDSLISRQGDDAVTGIYEITSDAEKFLARNKESAKGFTGLHPADRASLVKMTENLKEGSVDDIVKFRDFVDSKVAHLYDRPDAATPFERQLMKMRGQADDLLDKFSPEVNEANTRFADFAKNKSILGLNNEATVETITDNLYSGANKTAKKLAAQEIIPRHLLGDMQAIGANKAFEAAKKPGGTNYFKRGALGAITLGGSELLTNPDILKHGARALGIVEATLMKNPEALGKYAKVLTDAAAKGSANLAITHQVLQKDPEYQKILNGL
jgi:hypothetical protein